MLFATGFTSVLRRIVKICASVETVQQPQRQFTMAPSSKLRLNEKFLRKPGRNFQKFLNTFASLKQGQNRTDQMVLSPEEH